MAFISSEAAAAAAKNQVRALYFLRVATDPVLRCCSSAGDRQLPEDNVETTDGATYLGVGEVTDVPVFEAVVNGAAQRTSFVLSGVSDRVLALAQLDAPSIRGAEANFGVLFLGEDLQPVADMLWLRRGVADQLVTARRFGARSVALSIGWGLVNRRRPWLSFFTRQYQIRRSPTDKGCDRTPRYERANRKWPLWGD
ncbi:hypothetical protein [Brevundimonas sp.]|uniref:hypothetical protein n=1 Tax=Brevundimonas sp. TaxID=1871086 RepID=UPI002D57F92F|nr:hypothetical protein [Brevundimonas sp.]HYD26965.1 hypothetical protein [Brevundimonas sp.]